jgi:hypothetical protein
MALLVAGSVVGGMVGAALGLCGTIADDSRSIVVKFTG